LLAATGADFTKQPEKAHAQDENDKEDPEGEKEIRAWKLRQSLLALSMGNEAVKTRATTEKPTRLRRNQSREYLPQRRKGRKGRTIPNLAFLASWREEVRHLKLTVPKFARAAKTSKGSARLLRSSAL
jgi:hypothetical protein